MYQSSDPQEFYRGADRRENGCSRKVLLISFSNQDEIKRVQYYENVKNANFKMQMRSFC